MLLASQLLWMLFVLIGAGYSLVTRSEQPLANSILFGAFVCAAFEFLVISGAFTGSSALSAILAVVHPTCTFAVLGLPSLAVPFSLLAIGTGSITLAAIACFTPLLRRRKTSLGYDAVRLFQAFMKTWTSRNANDLERVIQDHGEPAQVTTKVIKFHQEGGEGRDVFIVLPGVHPGPFFPVGSYNFPGLVHDEFAGLGAVMTLHRPGGHERNLASNEQARTLASKIREFAMKLVPGSAATIRGPLQARIGSATTNSFGLADDLLATISFAPRGSDDLEPRVEDELSVIASKAGLSASIVDAHNSLGEQQEHPDTGDPGWSRLFDRVKAADKRPLRVAYAHSSEVRFSPGEDITDKGVGLLMLEAGGTRSVLILADANNAIPSLREESVRVLESSGYNLIEFCTSDSHDLAAKGLTVSRGYKALGEDTPIGSIMELIVALAKLAEPRLVPCSYASGQFTTEAVMFGSKALDEFASLAQSSSGFARSYSRFALVTAMVLFALTLIA
jgi:putative membrane protein